MSKKVDIISSYLSNYSQSFTGREIARFSKQSPQWVLNILKDLLQEGTMIKEEQGRNIKYSLTTTRLVTQLRITLAETQKSQEAIFNNFELEEVITTCLLYVDTLVIFGSFAKGNQKADSDIDIIVLGVSNKKLLEEKKKVFPREINIEYLSWKEFERSLTQKNHLAIEIKKDHLIYGNVLKLVKMYCNI